ncbi:MAG TPA: AmmeMemoRadiSam system radical SAM enzyme [Acidobacteriota bacterium]|nr:AmmeMemoRadiSam system radical SAM enzyme [Acidobacteriota bacterium]
MATFAEILEKHTVEGELFETLDQGRVRCAACAHRCFIREGDSGICRVRVNRGGILRVPFGYVSGAQADPIEKKPFFHVRPGSLAFSFGMLGCNLHCDYCQNWMTSQTLQDPNAYASPQLVTAETIVRVARDQGAGAVVSTYNEPLITAEWSAAIFRQAREAGLLTGFVSNGYATPEVLQYLHPYIDLFKVDLKGYDDKHYRRFGGRLQPVLDTIRSLHAMGVWVEVVTLLVPGFNDSREELTGLTEFLSSVSPDIPWHVTAFHADYKMTGPDNTSPKDLIQAAAIGRESGLRFIYGGNLPGKAADSENTHCPGCRALLVERYGFRILKNKLGPDGICPSCIHKIPGRW